MRRSLAGGLLPRRMWRWSGLWLVVCVGITTAQRPLSAAEIRAIETQPPPPPSPPEPPAPPPTPRVRAEGELKLLLVQALFRHGDRTPYSPLRDKHFWETTLPDAEDIAEISSLTIPLRSSSEPNCHPAAGNGPFGSLTIKGIAQMEARGELLRDALVHSEGKRCSLATASYPRATIRGALWYGRRISRGRSRVYRRFSTASTPPRHDKDTRYPSILEIRMTCIQILIRGKNKKQEEVSPPIFSYLSHTQPSFET